MLQEYCVRKKIQFSHNWRTKKSTTSRMNSWRPTDTCCVHTPRYKSSIRLSPAQIADKNEEEIPDKYISDKASSPLWFNKLSTRWIAWMSCSTSSMSNSIPFASGPLFHLPMNAYEGKLSFDNLIILLTNYPPSKAAEANKTGMQWGFRGRVNHEHVRPPHVQWKLLKLPKFFARFIGSMKTKKSNLTISRSFRS